MSDAEDARILSGLHGEVRITRASDEAVVIEVGGMRLAYVYLDAGNDEVRRQVRGRPTRVQAEAAARIMARALRKAREGT